MNRLKEKLRNEKGASLLIALLVFLLFVLVAATVLAAAVSNAGRARSNRAEQQRYQTLSSAMRLICGELEKTEYMGKYKYYTWDNGGVNYYYCEQQASGGIAMQTAYTTQTFKLTDFPFMAADGSLKKEMDDVFRKSFLDGSGGGKTGYKPLAESEVTTASSPVYLSVTLPPNLPGYPYAAGSMAFGEYEIPKTAKVKIELGDHDPQNIKLKLTAWLDDASGTMVPASGSGIMAAELKAEVREETEGVLTEYDVLEPHLPDPPPSPGTSPAPGASVTEKTVSVTWKLDNIRMTTAP